MTDCIGIGNLRVDLRRGLIDAGGQFRVVPAKEVEILSLLAQSGGQWVPMDVIEFAVWGEREDVIQERKLATVKRLVDRINGLKESGPGIELAEGRARLKELLDLSRCEAPGDTDFRSVYLQRGNASEVCCRELNRGSKRIWLSGPAGIGKTVVGWCEGSRFASANQIPFEAWDASYLLGTLKGMERLEEISREGCRRVVVVDDIQEEQMVGHLSEWHRRAKHVHLVCIARTVVGGVSEPRLEIEALSEAQAATLFIDFARLARREFGVSEADEAALRDLVHLSGRNPRVLEILAARVNTLPIRALADRFREAVGESLAESGSSVNLGPTLRWSCGLLRHAERNALRKLAIVSGGIKLSFATLLVGRDATAMGTDVESLLRSLVMKGLMRRRSAWPLSDEGQLRIGPDLRDVIACFRPQTPPSEELCRIHADFVLGDLEESNQGIHPEDLQRAGDWFIARQQQAQGAHLLGLVSQDWCAAQNQ